MKLTANFRNAGADLRGGCSAFGLCLQVYKTADRPQYGNVGRTVAECIGQRRQ